MPLDMQLLALVQRELGLAPGQLRIDSDLSQVHDSLDWLNLLSAVEDAFDLPTGSAQRARIRGMADLRRLVQERALG